MEKFLYQLLAFYVRHSPVEKGRYRLAHLARPIGRRIGHKIGERRIRTRHGFVMTLDLRDWIPQHIYLTGQFEATTSAIVKMLLKPGDAAVDVGANIGYFSLLFSSCVGASGRVYSFEPVPLIAERLRRNLQLNNAQNVSVSDIALSDQGGRARFFEGPPDNTGNSSLRESSRAARSFEVEMARADNVLRPEKDIVLVKIDVEGAELKVLRGMEGLLRRARPYLLVEITDPFLRELGDSAEALLTFLDELGYSCYFIDEGHLTLVDSSRRKAEGHRQWNALFTPTTILGRGGAVLEVAEHIDRRR